MCKFNWHKHPGGQILLVTGGRGWHQEEGNRHVDFMLEM